MSTTPHNPNHANGSIRLTSLADLGTVLDLEVFRAARATSDPPNNNNELSALVAQLATVNGGLEQMAREDARAREQAGVELARYEALLADRQAAQLALGEATRVRRAAEQLASEAFSNEARLLAAERVSQARNLELRCTELLAERTHAVEELASQPGLAQILAERRRVAHEEQEAAVRVETDRAAHLSTASAAIDNALTADKLDEAQVLTSTLANEFPRHPEVQRRSDIVRWRLRHRLVEPAEAALRDLARRPYRRDPEATMTRLSELHTTDLPEDLARRIFGLWSNACFVAIERRGWHEPRRAAPYPSRGVIWARPAVGAPYEVVSALDEARWQPGQVVPDGLATRAPLLKANPARDNTTPSAT